MRKIVRILGALLATLALAVGLLIGWLVLFRPLTRPVTDRKFARTPQRLERGRYLAEDVALCIRCHSPNNMRKALPGTEGSGWVMPPPHDNPLKHMIVAPNITPDVETGIGAWTDDEIGRAVREGVDRHGRSFTYAMPSLQYRDMSDEDLASIVVYLRSLAPVRKVNPKTSQPVFPVTLLVRLVPLPVTSPVDPDLSSDLQRGRNLVTLATCDGCHSPHDERGHLIEGLDLSGGDVLRAGSDVVTAPNITPDKTGIRQATALSFDAVMRTGRQGDRVLSALMPCDQYSRLSDADRSDIYTYLRSVKAVRHIVDGSLAATLCRVCGNRHGGGERN